MVGSLRAVPAGLAPGRFVCAVGSREWEEFVARCSAFRKPLAPDYFRVRGLAVGDPKGRVLEVVGLPAERAAEGDLPFASVELWAYPDLEVWIEAETGRVVSLAPRSAHGGVGFGELYSALVEKWGWPDFVEPNRHEVEPPPPGKESFLAVYDRPQGRIWWVVDQGRVKDVWIGQFFSD